MGEEEDLVVGLFQARGTAWLFHAESHTKISLQVGDESEESLRLAHETPGIEVAVRGG